MPHMSGASLADRIIELKPGIPVVYMTGGPVTPGPSHADDHQATKIRKPFTAQTLLQTIRQALDTT